VTIFCLKSNFMIRERYQRGSTLIQDQQLSVQSNNQFNQYKKIRSYDNEGE